MRKLQLYVFYPDEDKNVNNEVRRTKCSVALNNKCCRAIDSDPFDYLLSMRITAVSVWASWHTNLIERSIFRTRPLQCY